MEKENQLKSIETKIQKEKIEPKTEESKNFLKVAKDINKEGIYKISKEDLKNIIKLIDSGKIRKEFLNILTNNYLNNIIIILASLDKNNTLTYEGFENFYNLMNEVYKKLEKNNLINYLTNNSQENFNFNIGIIGYLLKLNENNLYTKKILTRLPNNFEKNFIKPYSIALEKNPKFFENFKKQNVNKINLLSGLIPFGGDLNFLPIFVTKVENNFKDPYELIHFIRKNRFLISIYGNNISKKEAVKEKYKTLDISGYNDISDISIRNKKNISLNHLISIQLIIDNNENKVKEAYGENFKKHVQEIGEAFGININNKNTKEIINLVKQINNYNLLIYDYSDASKKTNIKEIEKIEYTNKILGEKINEILSSGNIKEEIQKLKKEKHLKQEYINIFLHNFLTRNINYINPDLNYNITDYNDFLNELSFDIDDNTIDEDGFLLLYNIEKATNLDVKSIVDIIGIIYGSYTENKYINIELNIKDYKQFKKKQKREETKLRIGDSKEINENKLVEKTLNDLKNKFKNALKEEIYIGTEKISLEKKLEEFFSKESIEEIIKELNSGYSNLHNIIEQKASKLNLLDFIKEKDINFNKKDFLKILEDNLKNAFDSKKIDDTIDTFSANKKFNNLMDSIASNLTNNKIEKEIYKDSLTYIVGNTFFEHKNEFKQGNKYVFDKRFIQKYQTEIKKTIESKLSEQSKNKATNIINNLLSFNGKIEFTESSFEKLKKTKKALKELEKIQKLGINKYLEEKEKEENEKQLIEANGGILKTKHSIQDSIFANENISPDKIYTKYEEKGGLHYIHLKLPGNEKVFTIAALKSIDANREAINTYLTNMFNFNIKLNGDADILNKIVSKNTNIAKEGINTEDLKETTNFIQTLVYHNFHLHGGKKEKEFLKKHNIDNAYNLFSKPEEYAKHFSQAIKTESSIGGFQTDFQGFQLDLATIEPKLFDKNYQQRTKEKVLSEGGKKKNIGDKISGLWEKFTKTFNFS